MRDVPQESTKIDGDFLEPDNTEAHPLLETEDPPDTDQTQDENKPDYLDLAKKVYGYLGAPSKFLKFVAAILLRHDTLKDPRCDTQEKEMMIYNGLASCVDGILPSSPIGARPQAPPGRGSQGNECLGSPFGRYRDRSTRPDADSSESGDAIEPGERHLAQRGKSASLAGNSAAEDISLGDGEA